MSTVSTLLLLFLVLVLVLVLVFLSKCGHWVLETWVRRVTTVDNNRTNWALIT